jgi:hydroxymethylpyrimidine kinase/phosphomethylpyrimidine kinase
MIIVMTVAGFDPTGGAGVLADVKTISAFGCYGVAAVTSITAQNTESVYGMSNVSVETVAQQMEALFDDLPVSAVKTGLLPTCEVVESVADEIRYHDGAVVVVDPVLRSSSGFNFVDEAARNAMVEQLFPLATLVTPNLAEAELLTGLSSSGDLDGMERIGRRILKMGPGAVLLTGGDVASEDATDLLVTRYETLQISAPRIHSRHTHGTGCTLASGITCLLAKGFTVRESVISAKDYVSHGIKNAPGIGKGHGPLGHSKWDLKS